MLDFFGPGYDVAERMILLALLEAVHYPVARLVVHRSNGEEKFSLSYPAMRRRVFGDRHFNFMRGDLERLLFRRIEHDVEIRFGAGVRSIAQETTSVRVTLSDGTQRTAELLVGADGVHSTVRDLVFGPEERFASSLGCHAAAFVLQDLQLAHEAGDDFHTLSVPGRQVGLYPIRGGRAAAFFVHRSHGGRNDFRSDDASTELRNVYGDLGWVVPRLLSELDESPAVYFDNVMQIEMPRWSAGRVVLAGDACHCVSLLAGQGASLAMAGAYLLADELAPDAEVGAALERYERRMRPMAIRQRRVGHDMARWFVPDTRFTLAIRDLALRLSVYPLSSRIVRSRLAPGCVPRQAA
jgi:2-polyprenyl-6-methoxyphenol hydroxylase-like FAD-dependent oxidoreductase